MARSRSFTALFVRSAFLLITALGAQLLASAQNGSAYFSPGNIVVSRSVYDNSPNNVQVGQALPPNCPPASGGCTTASNDGTYPLLWNNDSADASFAITSKILLDQFTPGGTYVNSLEVPNSSQNGVPSEKKTS